MDDMAKKPRILLVDDEPGIRMYLRLMFSKKNFTVFEASNGKEGLDRVFSEHPDIVVLDVAMAGLSGIDLYRNIRQRDDTKNIPVIFCTALTLPDFIAEHDRSSTSYLNKPFDFEELYAKVQQMLRSN